MNKRNKILILLVTSMLITGLMGGIATAGVYPEDRFIDPSAIIDTKNFSIGKESYIAPFVIFRGDYLYIGNYSNVQDSGDDRGKIKIANDAVIAHGADLVGDVDIEDGAFIGFNSIVQDSKIGKGAYVNIGSKIIKVEIPAGKSTSPGDIIDTQEKADNLSDVTQDQTDFVKEVVEVNRALAIGYVKLSKDKGLNAFKSIGPNGDGDILIDGKDILARKGSGQPTIGKNTIIGNARVIGDVSIGDNSTIGARTSIRGDEGIPITIGRNAQIGEDDTFHSLNDKEIKIGDNFKLENDAVIHGPLEIGNNVKVGSRTVVFKSKIGNDVEIGDKAIIIGVEIPNDAKIPPDNIITDQKAVDKIIGKTVTTPERTRIPEETEKPRVIMTPAKQTPGFESIIGIVGLLLTIYILRRR